MNYIEDITAAILASAPLTAIIEDRFSWDIADGSTAAPYIVAQQVSDASTGDLSGVHDFALPLIQFSCWAKTKVSAFSLAETLRTEIGGKDLAGASNTSLGFAGRSSTFDSETGLFGDIIEFRASSTI